MEPLEASTSPLESVPYTTSSFSQSTSYSSSSQESSGPISHFGTVIPVRQPVQTGAAITKLEGIFSAILDAVSNGADTLSIPIRSRSHNLLPVDAAAEAAASQDGDNDDVPRLRPQPTVTRVSYPGRTEEEAKKFGR